MKLDSLVVVDVEVFRLSDCEHVVILQEADVADLVFGLELKIQVLTLPFKHN